MLYRVALLLLLAVPFQFTLSTQAQAGPIFFTDRATFDSVVGETTLLTFDTLPAPTLTPSLSWTWTFDDVFAISSDSTIGADSVPGTFCFCGMPNGTGGGTINPVLAFGVEITPLAPNTQIDLNGQLYILSQPQFFGFLFNTPSSFGIESVFIGPAGWSRFTIDNVEIKPVPEPSLLLLLGVGLSSLLGWHLRPNA